MPGQVLGDRYEVQQQLGKQAGRWTLLATDVTNQQPVVLKLLFIDENMGWNDLKLFGREVETLKSLSHPFIPQYLGYFELDLPKDGHALALVQTFIPGRSLGKYLQDGITFTEAQAKQIAKSLLEILIYLHGCIPPVVHRDIKPSNILLSDDQVYLVDFGSVKFFAGADTAPSTIVGTEGYMPPEQFGGRAIVASDLYSLGASLITLVTGTHPTHLPRRGVRIDLDQFSNLSPAFADWLSWMTEPRLDLRLKSAQESLKILESGQIRGNPS